MLLLVMLSIIIHSLVLVLIVIFVIVQKRIIQSVWDSNASLHHVMYHVPSA